MRVERREGYRLLIGGPVPPQADAITLRRTIVVRDRAVCDDRLLAHELVHVRQFRELGVARFLARYVGSYLRFRLAGHGHLAAYRRIPLEVEACWASRPHERDPAGDLVKSGESLGVPGPRPFPVGRHRTRPRRLMRSSLPSGLGLGPQATRSSRRARA